MPMRMPMCMPMHSPTNTREAHAQMAGPLKHTATRYVVYMRTGCWGWRRCGIDSVVSDWRATSKHPLRTLYLFSSSFEMSFFC